jgi:hypothetical protein
VQCLVDKLCGLRYSPVQAQALAVWLLFNQPAIPVSAWASALAGTLPVTGLLTAPASNAGAAVIASTRSSQQDARLLGVRRWVGESAGSTVLAGVACLVWSAA